ncbi:MAG: menaquinone biosynthesis family protein [Thermoplasmata archaeon]
MPKNIFWGHSPDPDDAYMLYGIVTGKVKKDGFKVHQVLKDIESLNSLTMEGKLDVTAVSTATMPYIQNEYEILKYGASMGDNYGPIVISSKEYSKEDLKGKRIALPGKYTSASLTFSIYMSSEFKPVYMPFDQIMDAVKKGSVDAGVLIHEGQLTYSKQGFYMVEDLGKWWKKETNLLLPLGLDVVKKDLGEDKKVVLELFKEGIEYSNNNREEALKFASGYGRGIDNKILSDFVDMYVNKYTSELGELGKRSIIGMMEIAHNHKLIPQTPNISFCE